jgi:hypothetical protein
MAKADLKTKQTEASVEAFIDALPTEQQRDDSRALVKLMSTLAKSPPKLWGPSIIGFGSTTLKYDTGREVDWMQCGFSPRKAAITLYFTCDIARYAADLDRLGKHTTGKGCLYIKRLADVDAKVLEAVVRKAVKG